MVHVLSINICLDSGFFIEVLQGDEQTSKLLILRNLGHIYRRPKRFDCH
jgi:hypothetical protein